MKANRKSIDSDDAVSPVIAVILMVAITVVLAATVYLWVSGFGANQKQLVNASFGAKAIDLPWANADTDSSDDSIEITLASADEDLKTTDISISYDGILLTWDATNLNFAQNGTVAQDKMCAQDPGKDGDSNWERGASVILVKPSVAGANAVCDGTLAGPAPSADTTDLKGIHTLKVTVLGQVVLDTSIEVHDSVRAN